MELRVNEHRRVQRRDELEHQGVRLPVPASTASAAFTALSALTAAAVVAAAVATSAASFAAIRATRASTPPSAERASPDGAARLL